MKAININTVTSGNPSGTLCSNDLFLYQGGWHDEEPGQYFRLDTLAICFVEKGSHSFCLNSREYRIVSGELLVCRNNDILRNLRYSDDFRGTFIFAAMDILSRTLDNLRLRQCLEAMEGNPVIVPEDDTRELLTSYCSLIRSRRRLDSDNNAGIAMIGQAMLMDIFNLIIFPHPFTKKSRSRTESIYHDFINILVSQPKKERDTAFYARQLSITPKYLSHVCVEVSDKTAKEWIKKYVMNDVRRYLTGTDYSIKEVSVRLGFSNFPFFCKSVKKYFGKTPLEIRNQM